MEQEEDTSSKPEPVYALQEDEPCELRVESPPRRGVLGRNRVVEGKRRDAEKSFSPFDEQQMPVSQEVGGYLPPPSRRFEESFSGTTASSAEFPASSSFIDYANQSRQLRGDPSSGFAMVSPTQTQKKRQVQEEEDLSLQRRRFLKAKTKELSEVERRQALFDMCKSRDETYLKEKEAKHTMIFGKPMRPVREVVETVVKQSPARALAKEKANQTIHDLEGEIHEMRRRVQEQASRLGNLRQWSRTMGARPQAFDSPPQGEMLTPPPPRRPPEAPMDAFLATTDTNTQQHERVQQLRKLCLNAAGEAAFRRAFMYMRARPPRERDIQELREMIDNDAAMHIIPYIDELIMLEEVGM